MPLRGHATAPETVRPMSGSPRLRATRQGNNSAMLDVEAAVVGARLALRVSHTYNDLNHDAGDGDDHDSEDPGSSAAGPGLQVGSTKDSEELISALDVVFSVPQFAFVERLYAMTVAAPAAARHDHEHHTDGHGSLDVGESAAATTAARAVPMELGGDGAAQASASALRSPSATRPSLGLTSGVRYTRAHEEARQASNVRRGACRGACCGRVRSVWTTLAVMCLVGVGVLGLIGAVQHAPLSSTVVGRAQVILGMQIFVYHVWAAWHAREVASGRSARDPTQFLATLRVGKREAKQLRTATVWVIRLALWYISNYTFNALSIFDWEAIGDGSLAPLSIFAYAQIPEVVAGPSRENVPYAAVVIAVGSVSTMLLFFAPMVFNLLVVVATTLHVRTWTRLNLRDPSIERLELIPREFIRRVRTPVQRAESLARRPLVVELMIQSTVIVTNALITTLGQDIKWGLYAICTAWVCCSSFYLATVGSAAASVNTAAQWAADELAMREDPLDDAYEAAQAILEGQHVAGSTRLSAGARVAGETTVAPSASAAPRDAGGKRAPDIDAIASVAEAHGVVVRWSATKVQRTQALVFMTAAAPLVGIRVLGRQMVTGRLLVSAASVAVSAWVFLVTTSISGTTVAVAANGNA